MKFSSIKEFFYKLQSRCYALLLLPLAIVIAFYLAPQIAADLFIITDQEMLLLLKIIFPIIAIIELTTVHLVIRSKLKKIVIIPGLGDRLDAYVPLTMIRNTTGIFVSMIMLTGLYLTSDILFTGYTIVMLLIVFIQRPTPAGVVRHLELRGSEKELILKGELV
jgi:hypothetical protein